MIQSGLQILLVIIILGIILLYYLLKRDNSSYLTSTNYQRFRNNYLLVHFLALISEWIQGPYLYRLYVSYGLDMSQITQIYISGNIAAAVFGTLMASMADKWGRKKLCLIFCVLFISYCLLLSIPNFTILLIGRSISGICFVLFYTIFESWVVKEHFSKGFNEEQLRDLLTWDTFNNGLAGFASGLISNTIVPKYGLWSPYLIAIFCLGLCFIIIATTWSENYGSNNKTKPEISQFKVISTGLTTIWKDKSILRVGLLQVFFEAAMITLFILWPLALSSTTSVELPYGVISSCLVLSLMVGSVSYKFLSDKFQLRNETLTIFNILFATVVLAISAIYQTFQIRLACFLLFEVAVGMVLPAVGSLRAQVVPNAIRSTTLSIFRLPQCLLVILLLHLATVLSLASLLALCAALLAISALPALALLRTYPISHSLSSPSVLTPLLP